MNPCTCNTEMGDTCPKCAPQPVAPTTVDPRDAELTSLRAALEAQTLANGALRGRVAEVEGDALALRSPLLSLLGEPSDSDLTDAGIVDKLHTRIVGAETHIAMHPGRYGQEDARELTTLRTTISKAHDALDLAGVSRGGTVEDRIARLALTQKPSDATRWAVVKAVVEEMGDEAVDIDATVPAGVVRVALAALRAVVL